MFQEQNIISVIWIFIMIKNIKSPPSNNHSIGIINDKFCVISTQLVGQQKTLKHNKHY